MTIPGDLCEAVAPAGPKWRWYRNECTDSSNEKYMTKGTARISIKQ